jgi:hypothetical protein
VHLPEDLMDGFEGLALEELRAAEENLHASQIVLAQRWDALHAVVYAFLDVDQLQLQRRVFVVVQQLA